MCVGSSATLQEGAGRNLHHEEGERQAIQPHQQLFLVNCIDAAAIYLWLPPFKQPFNPLDFNWSNLLPILGRVVWDVSMGLIIRPQTRFLPDNHTFT